MTRAEEESSAFFMIFFVAKEENLICCRIIIIIKNSQGCFYGKIESREIEKVHRPGDFGL
ncbi:hypothetical protein TTE1772 [Caldanaerobacter subterraneus subsp. tengcongensis MB4]|uniref:Uncharacterized protein n=1 Tax=Caldanaerobacter subterraneus subsp. tengcongensis (strain DSM 15242 / JCM 11007 / NBRC 100824 / MB4) TaxID=273068 RepID=Q8R954_CALS4|nr:hypothetical protein TTE1772 [Caldanaerobacter subterraneus subsp. tengcongensis MB4]